MTAYLLIILLMVVLSAFFSASEIAFNTSNKMRLKKAAEEGSKTAALAYKISEDFTTALSAILIGNNLANIAASTTATVIAMNLLLSVEKDNDALASLIATVVMTVVILIFGEIVPKILSKKNADRLVLIFAYPTRILLIILYPLVWLVMGVVRLLSKIWGKDSDDAPTVTEDELSSIIDTVEEEGVIDEGQSELLQSTLDFRDTTVEEIMTPRIDTVMIDIEDDLDEIKKVADESRFSRLPVYEDSVDNVIGVLPLNHYYKACLDGEPDKEKIRALIMPLLTMHKTMKLQKALSMMQEKKIHMAIVIDEFGGTMGIVTMEDILEELVGDIWDENDVIVQAVSDLGDDTYRVLGDTNIEDFFAEIDYEDDAFESEYSTVGGLAVERLNADPHEGDKFVLSNRRADEDEDDADAEDYTELFFTVEEMNDMRVMTVRVTVVRHESEKNEMQE